MDCRRTTKCTAILIISEGHETAFNGFKYQLTTGKPLKNLKLTLNYYYGNGSRDKKDRLSCVLKYENRNVWF
jgi:hypothetical protein